MVNIAAPRRIDCLAYGNGWLVKAAAMLIPDVAAPQAISNNQDPAWSPPQRQGDRFKFLFPRKLSRKIQGYDANVAGQYLIS